MKSIQDTYTLHNGIKIPIVGFGTWQAPDGPEAVAAVGEALRAGYRHIDTAAAYGNEASVGKAVRESGLPRKDIFITSKLWNSEHGYQKTLNAFEKTMAALKMDVLDLYLIHWPNPIHFRHNWEEANAESWRAMEELYQSGKIRSIGVSNFMPHHLAALLKTARIIPMVNQIRLCPGDLQDEAVAASRKHGILLEAYSPLGTGQVFAVQELKDIAAKHHKTVAQVSLRWSLQQGFLPLPKSLSPERIRENADLFDFELTEEDMAKITGLKGSCGISGDPDQIMF